MKHVYDRDFRYVPAAKTSADYLRQRFAEIRAEIEAKQKAQDAKVKPLIRVKA
jgi:hypothetical protein